MLNIKTKGVKKSEATGKIPRENDLRQTLRFIKNEIIKIFKTRRPPNVL